VAVLGVAVLAGTLTGCGTVPVRSAVTPVDVAHPVVELDQAAGVLRAVDEAMPQLIARDVASGGESTQGSQEPPFLDERITGPYREILEARIVAATAEHKPVPAATGLAGPRVILPHAGPWPRFFLIAGTPRPLGASTSTTANGDGALPAANAVLGAIAPKAAAATSKAKATASSKTSASAGTGASGPASSATATGGVGTGARTSSGPVPVVRVMLAPDLHHLYGLWAELALLPGVSLPPMDPSVGGVPTVAANASGLVESPQDALAGYAGLLDAGAGPKSQEYAPDPLRAKVLKESISTRLSVAPVASDVTNTFAAVPKEVWALRTKDGGALVIGAIRETLVITLRSGQSLKVAGGDLAALSGRDRFTHQLIRTSLQVVALQVPPAGRGLITALAVQRGDVAVAGG